MPMLRLAAFVAVLGTLSAAVPEAAAQSGEVVAQTGYLKASNAETGAGPHPDQFGTAVAIDGDTLVVGAQYEDSDATGVNGDGSNNALIQSGAAYVYVWDGASWSQQAYLKASNTGEGDWFGSSVAISGDTIAVGAQRESSDATGIGGDQGNDDAGFSGAVYVFVRNAGVWTQQAYIKASNTQAVDEFGTAVALDGDTLVVGAEGEDSGANGPGANQSNNGQPDAGAVYVFTRTGSTWSQQEYIKAFNSGEADWFGESVSISGDTLVVGARREDSSATGVDGDGDQDLATQAGAAYVFVRNGSTWTQQAYLKASNTDAEDQFGISVSVSGDRVAVGAIGEDSDATGVNGNQLDNTASGAGAAYVFHRSGTTWTQEAYLKASNTTSVFSTDLFGNPLSLSGDRLLIGALVEDSDATGIDGDQINNDAVSSGAAYLFSRDAGGWDQDAYIKASNTDPSDFFGVVSLNGDAFVVGASSESSDATGVDGDQTNNDAPDSGAAYAFAVGPGPWTDLGCATAGLHGEPGLSGKGTLAAGTPGALSLQNVPGGRPTLLLVSFASGSTPAFGGTLKPAVPWNAEFLFVIPGALDSVSSLALPWASFSVLPSGFELYLQFLIEDPGHFSGVALSNALEGVVP